MEYRKRLVLVVLVGWNLMTGAVWLHAGQRYEDFTTRTPLAPNDYLVLGFMGGVRPWNDEREGTRKLAMKLRAMNLPGVHVETIENRKRNLALRLIRNAFDRNRDGQVDAQERASVRLIVYGQSFGGAAVVKLARQLEKMDIPVLLTIQIDSVGRGDAVIPPNVRRAANLYQSEGLFIRGEREIRAEDPEKTTILGNFKFTYKEKKIDLSGVPWYRTLFRKAHAKMDRDPDVWAKVEELILGALERKADSSLRSE